ncbi:MAG: hypothetical protein KF819_38830 [Labilithrix sp.]|nr:hypothetical protein [Labilithrix sp.]
MPSLKLSSFVPVALALVSFAALGGCAIDAAEDEDLVSSEDAILAASLTPGTFKLYDAPRADPGSCDVHTVLELKSQSGARAALHERVGGPCRLAVFPDLREYRLRFEGTACGSKIYKGSKRIAGKLRNIKITDHRTRVCRDLVPAKIIVEETDRDGALRTKYSNDAPPAAATGTWLTIAPKQCGTNPWNGAGPAPGRDASWLQGEQGEVDDFFRGEGIALDQVGFAYPSEPRMVCMACSCPRGDALVVKAKSSADAARLVADYGFVEIAGALTTAPKQCGTNPWEGGAQTHDDRAETANLASWAKSQGAELEQAGFLDHTEPRMVCMACSCPRGDTAIAFPKSAAGSNELVNLGWKRVEN